MEVLSLVCFRDLPAALHEETSSRANTIEMPSVLAAKQ